MTKGIDGGFRGRDMGLENGAAVMECGGDEKDTAFGAFEVWDCGFEGVVTA